MRAQRKLNDKELRELLQKELKDEEIGFWLTPLSPESTGLNVHISPCLSSGYFKSQPKLFIQRSYNKKRDDRNGYFIITVEASPRIIGNFGEIEGESINQIFEFIKQNRKLLLQHWYNPHTVDSVDFCKKFKKFKIN